MTKTTTYIFLITILIGHVAMRVALNAETPLEQRHFYSMEYSAALAQSQGLGRNILLDQNVAPQNIAIQFLRLQQASLSAKELSSLAASEPVEIAPQHTVRPFEIWTAARLWSLFGVSWNIIFYFYIGLSALSCFCVFVITARISGRNWAGLIGALAYALTPAELWHTVWSIRDVNPTFFFSFALAFGLRCSGVWRSFSQNALSYFILGVLSIIGIGWRSDAMFIPPLMACLLGIHWYRRGWAWCRSTVYVACFILGVVATWQFFVFANRDSQRAIDQGATAHIAVYADAVRSNLGSYENFFQSLRDDRTVALTVWHLSSTTPEMVPYMSAPYGRFTRAVALEQGSYNAYRWVSFFPELWSKEIWRDLFTGYDKRISILKGFAPWAVVVFSLAILAVAFLIPCTLEALLLVFFSTVYSGLYWVMLPEAKHVTPLAVPWAVSCALACRTCMALVSGDDRKTLFHAARSQWRPWAVGSLAIMLCYGAALGAAYLWSAHKRQDYLTFVRQGLEHAVPIPDTMLDERTAAVYYPPETLSREVGMVWEIQTDGTGGDIAMRTFVTHPRQDVFHIPKGERRVWLYKTITQYAPVKKNLEYRMLVTLPEGSRFVSAEAFPVPDTGMLPFQTLYLENDASPGSPSSKKRPVTSILSEEEKAGFEAFWQNSSVPVTRCLP